MTALACGPMLPGNALLVTMSCIKTAPSDHGSNHQLLLDWIESLLDWIESEPHGDRSNLLTSVLALFNEFCFTQVQP